MPDYIFIDENGQLLANDAMDPHQAADKAQELARQYRSNVTCAEVVRYSIEPDTCPDCGEILQVDGSCGDCETVDRLARQRSWWPSRTHCPY